MQLVPISICFHYGLKNPRAAAAAAAPFNLPSDVQRVPQSNLTAKQRTSVAQKRQIDKEMKDNPKPDAHLRQLTLHGR